MCDKSTIQRNLRIAVQNCTIRSLNVASTWASEQLLGMNSETEENEYDESNLALWVPYNSLDNVESHEIDQIMFANSLFINGEYQRCAFMLKKNAKGSQKPISSEIGIFLTYYAQYMAGDKLKDQLYSESLKIKVVLPAPKTGEEAKEPEKAENVDVDTGKFQNNHLVEIYNALLPLYKSNKMDSYLLYLFAVIVRETYGTIGMPVHMVLNNFNLHDTSVSVDDSRESEGDDKQVC